MGRLHLGLLPRKVRALGGPKAERAPNRSAPAYRTSRRASDALQQARERDTPRFQVIPKAMGTWTVFPIYRPHSFHRLPRGIMVRLGIRGWGLGSCNHPRRERAVPLPSLRSGQALNQEGSPSALAAGDAERPPVSKRGSGVAQSRSVFWNHSASFIFSQHHHDTITNLRTAG
jgi:hypothetical protein